MVRELSAARFDPKAGRWLAASRGASLAGSLAASLAPAASPAPTSGYLSLATFNVWFDRYSCEARWKALLEILAGCDADVIALQEVTPALLERILEAEWIRAEYAVTDFTGDTVFPYGTLLLTRWTPARLLIHALPTKLWRNLLVAEFDLNGARTAIATAHLESKRSSEATRGAQLEEIFRLLAPADHAVLMGDFNFCSSWRQENERIDPAYLDLWPTLRPDEAGYTEDTTINAMLRWKEGEEKQVRYDRILLRSAKPGWVPASIRLLGDSPASAATPEVFPSDHFGLLASARWAGAL
jgi:tyrosyl-DNA phosphodiesterase 2